VEIMPDGAYPEVGVRSFGKGTFHKPSLRGAELGSKRLFRIEPGDLVFNNVFAWEGAVAVARPEDRGRFGSHRFITCVPSASVASATFLRFYFLTPEGLEKLGEASPGGAGRNRTLGLEALAALTVPVPAHGLQLRFDALQARMEAIRALQAQRRAEIDAVLPALLHRALAGAVA
jgi:type I restriction enzyme S subunit